MRYLADRPKAAKAVTLVPMREKTDCFTCVAAMLLGLTYEEVESAFGGNIDPSKGQEEAARLQEAFIILLERHNCSMIQLSTVPPIAQGRRYWVGVQIDDPSNSLSQTMSHGIVIDEYGKVFDPNRQYGEFESLNEWQQAMTLRHRIDHATEIFEYAL